MESFKESDFKESIQNIVGAKGKVVDHLLRESWMTTSW